MWLGVSVMKRSTDTEEPKVFRTDRFFQAEGLWYFATREGIDFGPFTIRPDGEKAVNRYIETQDIMGKLRDRDPTLGKDTAWDGHDVALAAKDVSNWRLDRDSRPNSMYADRSDKHR